MNAQTEKPLRVHLALALAEAICASAFVIELTRAESGNTLSWAYVFEWPILGAYAIYVWRKLASRPRAEPPPPATEGDVGGAGPLQPIPRPGPPRRPTAPTGQ